MEDIMDLDKEELIELIEAYNTYIQNANDENKYRKGWYPVCIYEFYNNEFQDM